MCLVNADISLGTYHCGVACPTPTLPKWCVGRQFGFKIKELTRINRPKAPSFNLNSTKGKGGILYLIFTSLFLRLLGIQVGKRVATYGRTP